MAKADINSLPDDVLRHTFVLLPQHERCYCPCQTCSSKRVLQRWLADQRVIPGCCFESQDGMVSLIQLQGEIVPLVCHGWHRVVTDPSMWHVLDVVLLGGGLADLAMQA